MDLNEIFKNNPTDINTFLSEILETNYEIKAMMQAIIAHISDGDSEKEREIIGLANQLKNEELLRIAARMESNRKD
ncbi:hypothetical protein [Costertonia aggregata]|uniref:Uncharacterized protein n=1 Tax=Costertonia aggregata TaxID=343403 RepID=A0A7H9AU70_9FLAO|nr:hypothetical protein [Costertonia aggregata]QLG47028.1 hypothetical protein HYG79_17260 [Costertonia aggregata]